MRRLLVLTVAFLTLLALAVPVAAQGAPDRTDRALPESVHDLMLDNPIEVDGGIAVDVLDPSLALAEGPQRVIVRLKGASLAEAGITSDAAQARYVRGLNRIQDKFMSRVSNIGAAELARVQRVLNAVFVEIDAAALDNLAADPDVARIAPVGNYEMDLNDTVPYTGAAAVQTTGVDGSGIKVAVLDSGIDYTHLALGGSGDIAEYLANDPTLVEPGTFPTAKVVGGYDFVGSDWPNAPEAPDPDPLDDGIEAGHGTHVAHIIGGNVTDATSGIYPGMAPGVDLYAVKVCSSVSTACSGIALIQGMDFAVDPNMDGKAKDRVDIVNMSLGSNYGQPFDDDLSAAVDAATALGVLTVSSAGNGGDKPFIEGSPSGTRTALSVAQTAVPSDFLPLMEVTAPAGIAGLYQAVFQPWSTPLTSIIEAPLMYGDGAGGNVNGCAPFAPGTFSGEIVLVDRGACNFTLKIKNIAMGGGSIGIIGLVAPGDPFTGGDGGDRPIDIPGYMISQADSNTLKSGLPATTVRFDPSVGFPLVGNMVGSSSRGPQLQYKTIKPEIGAPGASISAIAGSGTETGPFGGTSGAAPMVTGSAALLLDGYGGTHATGNGTPAGNAIGHGLDPLTVKALLMNNGETNIGTDPFSGLAPIARIGGGEVRVDRALAAPVAAFDVENYSGSLSFGFVDVADDTVTLTKTVTIRNLDNSKHTYDVNPTFRYADDVTNGAVSISAPDTVTVKPGLGRETTFEVSLTIDGSSLRGNSMNSGSMGADPGPITEQEYDGYLILDDGEHPIHLAWHVLPRKAAEVVPDTTTLVGGGVESIGLDNTGVGTAQNDAYALIGLSPDKPEGERGEQDPQPDLRAVGVNTFPVPAGFCSAEDSFIWAFAINTWERQTHAIAAPAYYSVFLDIDQDGLDDYEVFNFDASLSSSLSDGRNFTWAADLNTGATSAFFFAEHSTVTANTMMYICAEQVGLTGTDMLATNVDVDVVAWDWYFGNSIDVIEDLTITPYGEQFYGLPVDVAGNTYDPTGLTVVDFGPFPGNTPELGLMLVTNGDRGAGARGGATADTEAILFTLP